MPMYCMLYMGCFDVDLKIKWNEFTRIGEIDWIRKVWIWECHACFVILRQQQGLQHSHIVALDLACILLYLRKSECFIIQVYLRMCSSILQAFYFSGISTKYVRLHLYYHFAIVIQDICTLCKVSFCICYEIQNFIPSSLNFLVIWYIAFFLEEKEINYSNK